MARYHVLFNGELLSEHDLPRVAEEARQAAIEARHALAIEARERRLTPEVLQKRITVSDTEPELEEPFDPDKPVPPPEEPTEEPVEEFGDVQPETVSEAAEASETPATVEEH